MGTARRSLLAPSGGHRLDTAHKRMGPWARCNATSDCLPYLPGFRLAVSVPPVCRRCRFPSIAGRVLGHFRFKPPGVRSNAFGPFFDSGIGQVPCIALGRKCGARFYPTGSAQKRQTVLRSPLALRMCRTSLQPQRRQAPPLKSRTFCAVIVCRTRGPVVVASGLLIGRPAGGCCQVSTRCPRRRSR